MKMKNFIELYMTQEDVLIIRIFNKQLTIKLLYRFLKKMLTLNMKRNIFFRLNHQEFSFLKLFKKEIPLQEYDFSGFDEESINLFKIIVKKIDSLYRYKKYFPYIKFYSKSDYEDIKNLQDNFYNKITEVTSNIYQYDRYKLPIKYFEPNVFYFKHGIDKLTVNSINKIKNNDIIDAGAFIGDSALILSEYTDKNVYSFECSSKQYEILKNTIALNDKKNIIPVKFGLGDKEEKTFINVYNGFAGNSVNNYLNKMPKEKETINITTIDKFVEENNLSIGLIKSDVEGLEQELIRGAIKTIKKYKPVLLISVYHSSDDFYNIKPMIDKLNLGYKFKLDKPSDGNIILETILIAEAD